MRPSLDCSKLNEPRQIAGIDFKIVSGVIGFFAYVAVTFHAWSLLVAPVILLMFLRGPAKKDSAMLPIYLRHRTQRAKYSPGYIAATNQHAPRPEGFNRMMMT